MPKRLLRMLHLFFTVLTLALSIFVVGCTSSKKDAATPAPAVDKVVSLAIWSNYIASPVLADFERQTGIRVQVSHYSSNEELLAKLQAGASGYDVIVPSDYMISVMSKLGLVKKLERARLTSFARLAPRYLGKSFDPGNEYSVPYDAGTTGIAVNRDLYKGEIRGWKDLFEKPDLAGRISLLDDAREAIGAALKAQGRSLNSTDATSLDAAKAYLIQAKSRVKSFTSETLNALVTGEIAVAHVYSSDAFQARKQTGGKIDYLLPVEGGTFWIDNLAIPARSARSEAAYALINYLLEGKAGAATVQAVFVAPASLDAFALLPAPFRKENSGVFADEKALSKFELIRDLGDAQLAWDRAWTEIKAHSN